MTITFEELKQYNKLIIAQRQLVSVTMPFTPFFSDNRWCLIVP